MEGVVANREPGSYIYIFIQYVYMFIESYIYCTHTVCITLCVTCARKDFSVSTVPEAP